MVSRRVVGCTTRFAVMAVRSGVIIGVRIIVCVMMAMVMMGKINGNVREQHMVMLAIACGQVLDGGHRASHRSLAKNQDKAGAKHRGNLLWPRGRTGSHPAKLSSPGRRGNQSASKAPGR